MFIIGSFVGSIGGGLQCEYFGRKTSMMIENIIVICGLVCIYLANGIPLLFVGRFLTGYANGSNKSSILPYTSEVCEPKLRKFTGTLFVTCYTSGYAFMYILGAFLHWRQIAAILGIWPLISVMLLFPCPESPSWLLSKDKEAAAHTALFRLRGDKLVVEREMTRMRDNIKMQRERKMDSNNPSNISASQFLKGTFLRPFLVLVILTSFGLNYTGAPTLAFYLIQILKRGRLPIDPYVAAAWLVSYRVLVTVCTSLIFAPYCSRRKLYLVSGCILATGALSFGTLCYLEKLESYQSILEAYPAVKWLPIVAIGMLYTGLSGGYAMVIFSLLGELLPSNVRGVGIGFVSGTAVISFFLVGKFTPMVSRIIGLHGMFWIFACVGYSLVIFAYFCVPETYGRTLEDVENHYRKVCYGEQTNKIDNNELVDIPNYIDSQTRRPSLTDIYLHVNNSTTERKQSTNDVNTNLEATVRRNSVISVASVEM